MIYFLIVLILILLSIFLLLTFARAEDLAAVKEKSFILNSRDKAFSQLDLLEEYILSNNPYLSNFLGDNLLIKFCIPCFFIFILSVGFIGPLLTDKKLGLFLGLIIFLAYASRLAYFHAANFRNNLLNQLEKIILSIRNNLSTGMTLDNSVANILQYNNEKPLAPHLKEFVRISEINFIEKFPVWLKSIETSFRIRDLARSSQLLKLELQHNNNQEEAFLTAANNVADRISINRKQKNTISISLFTMDFMVLLFFAILFLVIPNISSASDHSWWQSSRRPLVVFISSFIIWFSYTLTILITLWRQK